MLGGDEEDEKYSGQVDRRESRHCGCKWSIHEVRRILKRKRKTVHLGFGKLSVKENNI